MFTWKEFQNVKYILKCYKYSSEKNHNFIILLYKFDVLC